MPGVGVGEEVAVPVGSGIDVAVRIGFGSTGVARGPLGDATTSVPLDTTVGSATGLATLGEPGCAVLIPTASVGNSCV